MGSQEYCGSVNILRSGLRIRPDPDPYLPGHFCSNEKKCVSIGSGAGTGSKSVIQNLEIRIQEDTGSGSTALVAQYLGVDDVGQEGGGHGLEIPVGLGQGGAELIQGVAHVQRHIVPSKKECIREYFFRIRIRNPDPGGQ
jgi:hypothetical protein